MGCAGTHAGAALASVGIGSEAGVASILVVEDSVTLRGQVTYALTRAGHKVTELPDAERVLRLVDRRRFDAVITGMSLPGTSSTGFTQSLRGVPVCRIAMPFDSAVLLEILNRVLRTRPQRLQSSLV